MESREKSRKTDSEIDEGFAVGRILGVIKRKDPQLYEELLNIAKADGAKGSDIVYDALQLYRDFRLFSGADPRCIAYAMRMIEIMMRRVLEMLAFVQQYMSADFFARQLTMYQALVDQMRQQTATEEKEQSKEKPKISESTRERLANMMVDLTMSLVKTIMSMAMRAPIPQTSTQSEKHILTRKPKIVISDKVAGGEGKTGSRFDQAIQSTGGSKGEDSENSENVSAKEDQASTEQHNDLH